MGYLLDKLRRLPSKPESAISDYAKNALNAKSRAGRGDNAFNAFNASPVASSKQAKAPEPGVPLGPFSGHDYQPPEPERAAWDASDWRAYYDERAAIREYDGQRPRAEAERLAWGETVDAWRRTFWVPPPAWQCAGCRKPLSGAPAIMDVPDGARVHDRQDLGCLIGYGRRWRSAAAKALVNFGIKTPGGEVL